MIRHLFLCAALFTSTLWAQAPSAVAQDKTVVPGKRVGGIGRFTSAEMLSAIYGVSQVVHRKMPKLNGELYDATIVGEGSDLELEVVWEPEAVHQRVLAVELVGKGWSLANGLKLGMTPSAVQKIHGKVFTIGGFGRDYGGYATLKDGALSGGLALRFAPLVLNYADSLRGDVAIPSDSEALSQAQVVVCEMSVEFR